MAKKFKANYWFLIMLSFVTLFSFQNIHTSAGQSWGSKISALSKWRSSMPSKQEVGQFFTSMSYKKRGAFFLVVLYIGLGSERFKNLFYYYPKLLLNFLQAKIKPIQSSYPLELNNYQEDEPESFEQAHNPSVNFFFVKEQDLDAPDYFSPFSITH